MIFCIPVRFCPLVPPAPFFHKGEGGILGVLMPETEDDTQGLPKKPTPSEKKSAVRVRSPARRRSTVPQ